MDLWTLNPATEQKIKKYKSIKLSEVSRYVDNSKKALSSWKELSVAERASYVRKARKTLLSRKEEFAALMTAEMGKPISESIGEIEKCAWLCEYFADNAEKFLQDEIIKTEYKRSYVHFDPLGVIACIMPWNFPFWQVFRFGVPAMLAGNTVLLRHSTVTLGCSEAMHEIFSEALPKNVFQNIIGTTQVAEKLIQSPGVNGVSFTGSVNVGRHVGGIAIKNSKKVVLELGGSDPFVVLSDADVNFTCDNALKGRFINTGQSCIAAKRFIIHKNKFEEFKKRTADLVSQLKVGDPMEKSTQIGPMVRENQLENLDRQVRQSVKAGARVLYGGQRLDMKGYFYQPTVLVGVKKGMPLEKEEVFGPVMPLISAVSDEEAIRMANDSDFGLGASVWTTDMKKAERLAHKLEAGAVSINKIVASDPRLPFGGIKKSGVGRELSRYGILEFCNIKSVVVK